MNVSKLHPNFVKILELSGIDPTKYMHTNVYGSNEKLLKFGSTYVEGNWNYDENTGIATQITSGFVGDEDKIVYLRKFVNNNGKLVRISEEII